MKLKKVNVKRQLKKTKPKKSIFIKELDSAAKQKFNVVLTDPSGQLDINIPVRDTVGRVKETRRITLRPNQTINLLNGISESDLIKSVELQSALNRNLIKYVEDDEINLLIQKPKIPYKERVSVPFEDKIKTEEVIGAASTAATEKLTLDGGTFFNFKIYAHGSTVKEDINDLNYKYAVLDENGKALLKIPIKLVIGFKEQLTSYTVELDFNFSDQTLYSFRNLSLPNGDAIGPTINMNTITDLRPDKYELWVYVFYRPSEIYENPINDLGPKRIQKVTFGIDDKNTKTFVRKQYTITTTAVTPLLDASGSGDV